MPFTPVILIHLLAALGAVVIGGTLLALRKGTPTHRLFGRIWVGLMAIVALGSFFIRSNGHFSWIHLLSVWTLIVLTMAIVSIRRGNIRAHKLWMTGGYSGLAIAGVFTLLPGRRLGHLLWHSVGLI